MTKPGNFKGTLEASGGWIGTFSGIQIAPLDPDPDNVRIEDIAHSLANQCRFTGHTKEFYSIAQHCYLTSRLVPKEYQLQALLHDASEAYLADLARPIKKAPGLGEIYMEVEERLEEAIAKKFNIPHPWHETVKAADAVMLWTEMRDLASYQPPDDVEMLDEPIVPWDPATAERYYLKRFFALDKRAYRGWGMNKKRVKA